MLTPLAYNFVSVLHEHRTKVVVSTKKNKYIGYIQNWDDGVLFLITDNGATIVSIHEIEAIHTDLAPSGIKDIKVTFDHA